MLSEESFFAGNIVVIAESYHQIFKRYHVNEDVLLRCNNCSLAKNYQIDEYISRYFFKHNLSLFTTSITTSQDCCNTNKDVQCIKIDADGTETEQGRKLDVSGYKNEHKR